MYEAIDVARYVVNHCNEDLNSELYGVSYLKLQNLMLYIQAKWMFTRGIPCFRDEIRAHSYGVEIESVRKEYRRFGGCTVPAVKWHLEYDPNNIWELERVPNEDVIADEDEGLIDEVLYLFRSWSAADMRKLLFAQRPWKDAYTEGIGTVIRPTALAAYFAD